MSDLLIVTTSGLYCPAGDFYIDPWRPVRSAVITHAHSDHATSGSDHYLSTVDGLGILQARLGPDAKIQTIQYGEHQRIGDVTISLHPAGHILGSAQVRIDRRGEIWVVTGDYKTASDPTCLPFAPIRCHTLITESTFGLPIYRWENSSVIFEHINTWWQKNAANRIVSMLYAYSLGKAQRLLVGLDSSIGPIFCHGAVERVNGLYRQADKDLPQTMYAGAITDKRSFSGSLIVAPISAHSTPWIRRFGDISTSFVSGWMQIRGARRRRSVDRGFALSDHADWSELLAVIRESSAERVLVTHGFVEPMVRWLTENGWQSSPLHTEYRGEFDELGESPDSPMLGEEQ